MAAVARGGATRKKRNRKRWSGQDCCNPPQSPIGCPTYDFTENPPTSAYAGTSGFYVINIQLCILNWTTLSIVMRLWINNWTHAVVGQFANNENCHNFLPHDTPYLYDFFFLCNIKEMLKTVFFSIQCSSMTTKTFWLPNFLKRSSVFCRKKANIFGLMWRVRTFLFCVNFPFKWFYVLDNIHMRYKWYWK